MHALDLSKALEVARLAAEKGAVFTLEQRDRHVPLGIREKRAADFVTDVDEAAQQLVVSIIRERYPDHRVLAEEVGMDGGGDPASPYLWIIDPLDGTTPYIHGKRNFGTIVALQYRGSTVVGAITLPDRHERFWGTKGGGAFFNGSPIVLRHTRDLANAILCTNTNAGARCGADGVMTITAPRCASLQNYGSSACEVADLLKGENDGCFFTGIRLWDAAAGCLLTEEAGGRAYWELVDPDDERGYVRGVMSTKPIFEELKQFVLHE